MRYKLNLYNCTGDSQLTSKSSRDGEFYYINLEDEYGQSIMNTLRFINSISNPAYTIISSLKEKLGEREFYGCSLEVISDPPSDKYFEVPHRILESVKDIFVKDLKAHHSNEFWKNI